MAVYRGKIDLIDMREIAQASSLFTWIKYADDIQGNGMSSNPEGKNYIGMAYNKNSSIPSNDPLDYTWTLFRGQNGLDANQFKLKLNQTEILKFIDEDDHLVISPNVLTAAVMKDDIYNLDNQIQITNLNIDNFTAEIYDIKSGKWANISKVFEIGRAHV